MSSFETESNLNTYDENLSNLELHSAEDAAKVTLSEDLEEVEKVLDYLSVNPGDANTMSIISNVVVKSGDSEFTETEKFLDDANTSNDIESSLNDQPQTEFSEFNDVDTHLTTVTKSDEFNPLYKSEDSLDVYLNQFKTDEKIEIVKTPYVFKKDMESDTDADTISKTASNYEEPTPSIDADVKSTISETLDEDCTEITISVKRESKIPKPSKSKNLSAILFLKERKNKNKRMPIINLNISGEELSSPIQKSETRWFVYPINTKPKSINLVSEHDHHSVVKSPKPSKVNLNYDAADEDYFTEILPQNGYFKNLIIERPVVKHLGITKTDPVEYQNMYKSVLVSSNDLPTFVHKIPAPTGYHLAYNAPRKEFIELEGDIDAFKYVDLDKEGLSDYKDYLSEKGVHYIPNY